ncbi:MULTISPECIES: dihydrolipoamide acetyltransferase family protein [Streptomyces]|uniref:dihydrolipoamide acetyltransferase family protein n=1 Tax=Streptomyces TaxID=1883 RepID=UPI00103D3856|nr:MULTISPECIES: dihydrolipoamide acetyltransferase family protein [Streptomyces]MBT3077011.1 2-oxo acid dehydrogenase subunit E2 [Streptomyces sp. COG21]MBT3082331.1 2-oxo acid dehydrogenase subunit E2 [Streptomyces sp. COG20]MBT3097102.1 2-oxo acid dehydrogenase subunit E2 [Streptomyces sp. CBG30]MBT3104299.1 2-oxo acid dehydrogenase subunit E2 [Streptomyces sp. COG19]MBT3110605.1 2-oxo acid dehydrogenase subunit E2 [Streptomyces sp. CYG20]
MAQVLEFKLPDLGEGLTEAEIVRWLVEVGDVVAIDQPVVEVETAKAMVEVPCPYGGVVTARFGEEGSELPVGAPLLTVAVGATEAPASPAPSTSPASSASGASSAGAPAAEESSAGSGNVLVGYGTGAPAARRRRIRPERVGTPAAPAPVVEPEPVPVAVPAVAGEVNGQQGPVAVVSPLVRRLARQHEIDLRRLTGSGPDGLILRADVDSAIREAEEAARAQSRTAPAEPAVAEAPTAVAAAPAAAAERIPLRGVRGAVADKLSRSRSEIPDATCWVDADATELMAARAAMNAASGPSGGPKVSVLALLARICTAALARYPELNSTVDTAAREIVRLPGVHLGFAAQTERGLVVPVVRDAHTRNAESIGAEIARLTELARTGKLSPAQLTGGTFTLNNYGVFGVDGSTPIINHPEAAMLGVGRIMPKPWVHNGELAVRQVVQLSLTFDHRVCDGGTAGGFLRYVADCVEQPAVLLRTL